MLFLKQKIYFRLMKLTYLIKLRMIMIKERLKDLILDHSGRNAQLKQSRPKTLLTIVMITFKIKVK